MCLQRLIITVLSVCMTVYAHSQIPGTPFNIFGNVEDPKIVYLGPELSVGFGQVPDLHYSGLRVSFEERKFRAGGAVGILFNEEEDTKNSLTISGDLAYVLTGQAHDLIQILIQSGIGYNEIFTAVDEDFKMINIPLALGIGINVPMNNDWNIWIAPRGQWRRSISSSTQNDLGIGLNVGASFALGGDSWGLYAAFDTLDIEYAPAPSDKNERSLSVGIRFCLR